MLRRRETNMRILLFTEVLLTFFTLFVNAVEDTTLSLEQQGIYVCHPPMEQLLVGIDNMSSSPIFESVKEWASGAIDTLVSTHSIDSISFAVFSPSGDAIYEKQAGILRPNSSNTVDRNTIYRIASTTKLFTTMEVLHLAEDGDLDLDVDILEYMPEFKYPSSRNTWRNRMGLGPAQYNPTTPLNMNNKNSNSSGVGSSGKITTRQLLGQRSGVLRDVFENQTWPLFNQEFPKIIIANSSSQIFETIRNNPMENIPSAWPAYSNVAFILAGRIIENVYFKKTGQRRTYAEIIEHDILDPLNMSSTYFTIPNSGIENLAVPNSTDSIWASMDLTVSNGAFGLSSTAVDLVRFGQAMLSNYHSSEKSSVLPIEPATIRDWLRPAYTFSDNLSAVGHPWEIFYYPPPIQSNDSAISSRKMEMYTKDGSIPGYLTYFMLDPSRQFGAILLYTGETPEPYNILEQVATKFGAAFSEYRTILLSEKSGTYCLSADERNGSIPSGNGGGEVVIKVEQDSLWMTTFTYRGIDILQTLGLNTIISPSNTISPRFSLWPVSEKDIYRIGIGIPPINHYEGCMMQFTSIGAVISNNFPYDMVAITNGEIIFPPGSLRYSKSHC